MASSSGGAEAGAAERPAEGQSVDQGLAQGGGAGDHPSVGQVEVAAVVGADLTAGLFHQHHTGHQVPGGQASLPVAVDPAGGDEGQIHGGGTRPAHPVAAVGEPGELGVVVVETPHPVIGESGDEQGIRQAAAVAHLQAAGVAPGTPARGGPVVLFERRHLQGAEQGQPPPAEPHGGAEERIAMGVVGGAIEGVDAPLQVARALPATAFLGQHGHGGGMGRQNREYGGFGRQVGFGDQVAGNPLLLHLLQPAVVVAEFLSPRPGGLTGHLDQPIQLGGIETGARQGPLAEGRHSSSRGRPGRTRPRPKKRPNCRS